MNLSDKSRFFNDFAIAINTSDIGVARSTFFAIARFIVNESKKKGRLEMPDLGTFLVKERKAMMSNIPNSTEKKFVGPCKVMTFRPDYKVKKYLNL